MKAPEGYPRVLITEESPRDGLQIEREGVTVEQKLELIDALVAAGIRRIVVGAFVNAKWSPQMGDTEQLVKKLKHVPGVSFFALALNDRGRELRKQFSPPLSVEPLPVTHLHMCDVFIVRNTNRTMEDQERTWQAPIERAAQAGAKQAAIGLSAGWGSNWRGAFTRESRMRELQRQCDAWKANGIEVVRVDLADPMGWNTPLEVAGDLTAIKAQFPTIREFRLHMHNARGMAMLSTWQAIHALAAEDTLILDTAVGGIGGCPYCGNGQATGMIPTEDLVHLLNVLGIDSGVDLDKLIEASQLLSRILGRQLDGHVTRSGGLPSGARLYDMNLPVLYTFDEAQHFRLGASAVQPGRGCPWIRTAKA